MLTVIFALRPNDNAKLLWNFANINGVFAVVGNTAAQEIAAGLLRVLKTVF
jgi:hypothetical protein